MISRLAALASLVLLIFTASSHAGPQEGRYTGVLRLTKIVDGVEIITSVKAAASVRSDGLLTIVLATATTPIPESVPLGGTPKDVLRAQIKTDGTCILPINLPAHLPSTSGVFWVWPPISLPAQPDEQFRGRISTKGNTFTLSYNNIPIPPVPPDPNTLQGFSYTSLTKFDYTFRLIRR